MAEYEKYITHLSCPNCGGNMELKPGWQWACPYCETSFYVVPAKKTDLVMCRHLVDNYAIRNLKEENKQKFEDCIKQNLIFQLAEYLLNNDYLTFDKLEEGSVENYFKDVTEYLTSVRVIKKDN